MRRTRLSRTGRVLLLLLAFLLPPGDSEPVSGQEASDGPWSLEIGAGAGMLVAGHDHSDAGQWSPAARVGLDRRLGASLSGSVEWAATWPASRLAGGRERRHHLGLGLATRPPGRSLSARVGAGFALSTVIEQDGPPDPPDVGDAVISVGDTMGASFLAGVARPVAAGTWVLVPRVDALVQRVQGRTLAHLLLTGSVAFGR